jgi:hypothetical protein
MKKIRFSYFSPIITLIFLILSCENEQKETDPLFPDSVSFYEYYPNDGIKSMIQRNKKGQLHGYKREYYENGNLEYERMYFKNRLVCSEFWYHRNQNLAFYSVRDFDDSVFFFLKLDPKGKVIKHFGHILNSEYETNIKHATLHPNKTYKIRFLYADPKIFKFNLDSVILETENSRRHFKNYYLEDESYSIILNFIASIIGFFLFRKLRVLGAEFVIFISGNLKTPSYSFSTK